MIIKESEMTALGYPHLLDSAIKESGDLIDNHGDRQVRTDISDNPDNPMAPSEMAHRLTKMLLMSTLPAADQGARSKKVSLIVPMIRAGVITQQRSKAIAISGHPLIPLISDTTRCWSYNAEHHLFPDLLPWRSPIEEDDNILDT